LLNLDQWDGFFAEKQELLELLGSVPNTVIISGDLHSSFAGGHNLGREGARPVFEFTGTSVSSATMEGAVVELAESLGFEQAEEVAGAFSLILKLSAQQSEYLPHDSLEYAETGSNGYVVVEVNDDEVVGTFHHYPSDQVSQSYYDDPESLEGLFQRVRFVIRNGELTRR
jgi:hypothetical protein